MESKVGEQEFFTAEAQDAEKVRSFGLPICVIRVISVKTLDFPIPSTTNLGACRQAYRQAFRQAFREERHGAPHEARRGLSRDVSRGPVWGNTTHRAWKLSQSR